MKIAIGYPPLKSEKGIPQISQNRQFQWTPGGFSTYFIYPVVPASAATLLKNKGYQVVWLDGLAKKWSFERWLEELKEESPDVLALEVKTPVIKKIWQIVNQLKKEIPRLQIVLMGDHVTALPEESLKKSKTDFVIAGGDYDFLLLSLMDHLSKKKKLVSGVWCWSKKPRKIINSGEFKLKGDLEKLPPIDRDLTQWHLYSHKNSNFYRAPGAYTMFGRDCWWGKCTFCSWTTLFPGQKYRVVGVKKALDEVGGLINGFRVKEIMDDSGTFPNGDWLREFCRGMIKRKYHQKVSLNCNLRFNADLTREDYLLMGKAGFRFLLYGLESASQRTLDRINKNLKIEQVFPVLRWAKEAGLAPHLTIMVGYPWEGKRELAQTLKLGESLFARGLADSMQATLVVPYPGTPLFDYCQKNKLLRTVDWDRYDMREPIMKTDISKEELMGAIRQLYSRSVWNPRFILNTLSQLKSWDGIKYVGFQGLKYLGKLGEFK